MPDGKTAEFCLGKETRHQFHFYKFHWIPYKRRQARVREAWKWEKTIKKEKKRKENIKIQSIFMTEWDDVQDLKHKTLLKFQFKNIIIMHHSVDEKKNTLFFIIFIT